MAEVGRPRVFETEEELQQKIDEYYEFIKGEFHMENMIVKSKDGSITELPTKIWDRHPETPSITGLALFLGFESRQSIYDYEKNGEFSYSIKKAKLKVEASYEQFLLTQSCTGAIFALKNFGWVDRQEIDHSGKIGMPQVDYSKLSDAALEEIANAGSNPSESGTV